MSSNPNPEAKRIYKRGTVYWLAQQRNRKRVFISLETGDFVEAITKANGIRERPEMNEGGLIEAEIDSRSRSQTLIIRSPNTPPAIPPGRD